MGEIKMSSENLLMWARDEGIEFQSMRMDTQLDFIEGPLARLA